MAKQNGMRKYKVTITGRMPIIHHADDVLKADALAAWRKQPENKKSGTAGDDRSPAWMWISYLYTNDSCVVIPSDNIMTSLMEGAALVPTGKRQKTFKAQSQSGMLVFEPSWPMLVGGAEIPVKRILELIGNQNFEEHQNVATELGFQLFVKRAKIGQSKHVRVRPYFEKWSASGTITVWDDQITREVLRQIIRMAGQYKGLCDWRPGSPRKPGPFGTFDADVTQM